MRVNSLRLITRLVTDRRPIASRLAQPVAWLEEYFQPATKGAPFYLKPGLLPITPTEETLEWSCSASRGFAASKGMHITDVSCIIPCLRVSNGLQTRPNRVTPKTSHAAGFPR